MKDAGSLEFAFARLSARYGDRPGDGLWRRIEHLRDFADALTVVRASPLAPWVVGVGTDASADAIEAAARRHWRGLVAEVAGWMPAEWAPAIAWCARLTDLPLLLQAAHPASSPPWLGADPPYEDLAEDARRGDRGLALLRAAAADGAPRVIRAWRAEWARRLPGSVARWPLLGALVTMLDAHAQVFRAAHPADGWPLRRALQLRLSVLFRRAALDPAAAFVFLALSALEYERIRGELLRRHVFPAHPLAA
jgi:hypothetical protein